jgi:hypothetical protein
VACRQVEVAMRAVKLGCLGIIAVYALLFVAIGGALLIDQALFRVARVVVPEAAPNLSAIVVGAVSLALVGGLAMLLVPRLHRAQRRVVATVMTAVTGGVAVAFAANGFSTIARNIVADEAVAATVAVARPACLGTAVPAAGSLITGTTVNHVLVLDSKGMAFDWTGSTPSTWRALTISDVEVIVCVEREQATYVGEVCGYSNGPDITRHTAVRNVRIVEPSTGKTLGTLAVESAARACAQKEERSLTDLYGSVEWPLVRERVAGWLTDHGAMPGAVES